MIGSKRRKRRADARFKHAAHLRRVARERAAEAQAWKVQQQEVADHADVIRAFDYTLREVRSLDEHLWECYGVNHEDLCEVLRMGYLLADRYGIIAGRDYNTGDAIAAILVPVVVTRAGYTYVDLTIRQLVQRMDVFVASVRDGSTYLFPLVQVRP